ncbi:MAG: DUF1674 domain-containing protein [Woeseiaceae bacterium]|nr:DUF1674 domain-containing protein [Woeseiaceae bacterium]
MITRHPKAEDESAESKPTADDAGPRTVTPTESGDAKDESQPREIGGRKGPDPTRFGDWEKGGRCIDF